MNVCVTNTRLVYQAAPTYLDIALGTSLTYKQHLDTFSAKIESPGTLKRRPSWVASTKITHLYLGSSGILCAVWCRRARTSKLDASINNSLRIDTDCLKAFKATEHLSVLEGIAPPTFRRQAAVLALEKRAGLGKAC